MEHGCVVRLYNSVITDLSRELQKKPNLPFSIRLAFTDETLERRQELVSSFRMLLDGGQAQHNADAGVTTGHWRRSVD